MKISTTKEKILNAILMAERIVGKKESLPVLSCILFDVKKEILLRATNLEAGIEIQVPGDIQEEGTVAVPATVLSQTIRAIGVDKVTLSLEDGNLLVESKGTRTLIKAIPHSEFPILPAGDDAKGIEIEKDRLVRGLQSVSYAASPSMIRPELGSVYVKVQDGSMVCVATDSFRLAEKTIVKVSNKASCELLIPLKHASELLHVLDRIDGAVVAIGTDDSQLVVRGGGARFTSRVVDAAFPNYREIIPKSFVTEATMLKNDLSDMLKKARVFSGAEMHIGLHIYPKKKIFSATARSADVGEMSDSADAALSGDDLDINFHIGYLSDCLQAIESDSVVLSFAGPGRPLVIRGVSDSSFLYLVMPLNR